MTKDEYFREQTWNETQRGEHRGDDGPEYPCPVCGGEMWGGDFCSGWCANEFYMGDDDNG